MVGIYKITSPNNKVYIGQSTDVIRRWAVHLYPSSKSYKLRNSLLKYGVASHTFEIIHELPADASSKVLDDYEQLYMDLYRSVGIELMNLKEAGSRGRHSIESRIKIGAASKGHVMPCHVKDILRQHNIGHTRNKGKEKTEVHKKNISAALRGVKKSDEHNRKNSEAKKGCKCYLHGIDSAKHPKAKKIKCTSSGRVYGTIKEAAASIGIKRTTLSMMLIGKNKNK